MSKRDKSLVYISVLLLILPLFTVFVSTNKLASAAYPAILIVENSDPSLWYADYGLNQLGINHETVKISDFGSVEVSKYQIIIVGTLIGPLGAVKPVLDQKSADLQAWINSGGCIVVFCQYVDGLGMDLNGVLRYDNQGSGYYEWLPGKPTYFSVSTDIATIIDTNNPITQNLTSLEVSYWDTSSDGYFPNPPGKTLAIQSSDYSKPVLYMQNFGKGKIVVTSLDADFHGFVHNGRGVQGMADAQKLFNAILDWFGAFKPLRTATDISLFTSTSTVTNGYKIGINGKLVDKQKAPLFNASVDLAYLDSNKTWTPIATLQTGIDGTFNATWETSTPFNVTFKAQYLGNETYLGTEKTSYLEIQKPLSLIITLAGIITAIIILVSLSILIYRTTKKKIKENKKPTST
jgi:hypothetical protein